MYYTISAINEGILEASEQCPDPQEQANFYSCGIYIIEGEHSGLSAIPKDEETLKLEQKQKADQEKLRLWREAQGETQLAADVKKLEKWSRVAVGKV